MEVYSKYQLHHFMIGISFFIASFVMFNSGDNFVLITINNIGVTLGWSFLLGAFITFAYSSYYNGKAILYYENLRKNLIEKQKKK